MNSDIIKEILYSQIHQIPEQQIQAELSSQNKEKIIKQILQNCIRQIHEIKNNDENLVILAEAFTHFLLTHMLIPSQRKVHVDGFEVDIVIPDTKTLNSSPQDSLVLHFVKVKPNFQQVIFNLKKIQPKKENIWLISNSINSEFKTYQIKSNFALMFGDIEKFLAKKKQKLKIFRT